MQESLRSRRDNEGAGMDPDMSIDLTHSIFVESDNDLDALEVS